MLSLDHRFSPRRRYLLGISGGRDSVALFHTLLELGARKIVLCHLNHQLRGIFSNHDAAFVRRLAEDHDLPFEIARVHVQRRAEEEQCGIELAARRSRHEFFAVCARKHRCNSVLLAHHADDNAETVLFNLMRGSAGLRGMSYESSLTVDRKKLTLVRPMLDVRRSEIDAFLTEHNLQFQEDASNSEPFTARNRFRLEAFPLLEDIMKRDVVPSINRAARISSEDRDTIFDLLDHLELRDPQDRLFLPKVRKLPESLQRRALFVYLQDQGIGDLSQDLLTRSLEILDVSSPAKVNLPGDYFLRRRSNRLFVE